MTKKGIPMTHHTILPSPLGNILLIGEDDGLTSLHFQAAAQPAEPPIGSIQSPEYFKETICQLDAYFRGDLRNFNLRLLPKGSEFQRDVWKALCRIPYGATISYKELARSIGKPSASRAVGGANGRNPIPIIIPCHRVINGDGQLGGYSCGLEIKKYLLNLEAKHSKSAINSVIE
jgi:methylated-DNA-[protein]-cysteine S-methyltransferase